MNDEIIQSLQKYLEEKGFNEKSLSLSNLLEVFIDYYQKEKFIEFSQHDDSDMLLFQYGTYPWEERAYFQINFTRQFYEVYEDQSHQIYQVGVTFFYSPQNFSDIISLNKWSVNFSNLIEFHSAIINSNGFKKALNEIALRKKIVANLL